MAAPDQIVGKGGKPLGEAAALGVPAPIDPALATLLTRWKASELRALRLKAPSLVTAIKSPERQRAEEAQREADEIGEAIRRRYGELQALDQQPRWPPDWETELFG